MMAGRHGPDAPLRLVWISPEGAVAKVRDDPGGIPIEPGEVPSVRIDAQGCLYFLGPFMYSVVRTDGEARELWRFQAELPPTYWPAGLVPLAKGGFLVLVEGAPEHDVPPAFSRIDRYGHR